MKPDTCKRDCPPEFAWDCAAKGCYYAEQAAIYAETMIRRDKVHFNNWPNRPEYDMPGYHDRQSPRGIRTLKEKK